MEYFNNLDMSSLSSKEMAETSGGVLINVFLWGVAYGYVKEKFESGQW